MQLRRGTPQTEASPKSPSRYNVPFSISTPKHGTLKEVLNVKVLKSAPMTPANQAGRPSFSRQQSSVLPNPNARPPTPKIKLFSRTNSVTYDNSPKRMFLKNSTPMNKDMIQAPDRNIMSALTNDSHIRNKSIHDKSKLQIEARKTENSKGYFILKNIHRLQQSYSQDTSFLRDRSQDDLNKRMLQHRQKNLLEIYIKNERNNVTEEEREKFWNFLSGQNVNAMIDFRTLDLEPIHVEMAEELDNHKMQHNKKIRTLFNQVEAAGTGHYVNVKDIAKFRVHDALDQLNQVEEFNASQDDIGIEKKDYMQERNRLMNLSLNAKIGARPGTSKAKGIIEKKRFRQKPSRHQVAKSLLAYFKRLIRLDINLNEFTARQVFSSEPYQKDGAYTFMKSIKSGSFKLVKDLLNHSKFLVYDFDEKRRTGLHLACSLGNYDIVKLLLEYNADTEAFDKNGMRPLDYAIQKNRLDLVQILLYKKAVPWSVGYIINESETDENILKLLKLARRIDIAISLASRRKKNIIWEQNKSSLYEALE